MKIYFAGSISGGRNDQQIYLQIITLLKGFGEVLTEHIGDNSLDHQGEAVKYEPAYIYQRDREWLTAADVLVAEITQPSLGVGYELGLAESQGKKVLCLFRKNTGRSVSSMIKGNPFNVTREYESMDELNSILQDFFDSIH